MVSAHSVDCSLCSSFANFTELPSYIEVRLHLDNLERSSTWLDLHQTSHGGPLLVSLHSLTNPASHIAMAGKSPGGGNTNAVSIPQIRIARARRAHHSGCRHS